MQFVLWKSAHRGVSEHLGMQNLHPVVAVLWHPSDSSPLSHYFLIEMIQSEQDWVYLNDKQAGLGAALQSPTFISPGSCCQQDAAGLRAGQGMLQGNALPLRSPSSLEGSDPASQVQIKAAASKETTVGEKGESIFLSLPPAPHTGLSLPQACSE